MILFYFPSGGCVDDVFDNQTNYQFISAIAIHFMNGAEVCWNITRTVSNVFICTHNQIERCE